MFALALWSGVANAAPKTAGAKLVYEQGIAAYAKGDYAAAVDQLTRSAALEDDPDTLFTLAQAQRKLDHCDYAVPLYERLLVMELAEGRKQVVEKLIVKCKQRLGTTEPSVAPEPEPPKRELAPEEPEPPARPHRPQSLDKPAAAVHVRQVRAPAPWYHNAFGDTLVLTGLAGIGVGGAFMMSASTADDRKSRATTYADYVKYSDRATHDGQIGVAGLAGGGALVMIGIVWYATHRERLPVTAWLAPGSGGAAYCARF
jgi:hypothetical protein